MSDQISSQIIEGLQILMKYKTPFVSVVMPAYNAGSFLVESVTSILNQTHKNLELIIVNDASTDETLKIVEEFKRNDKRVRVFSNKKRLGVSKSASIGVSKARGKFVARMDADDVALPMRIEKQIDFLVKNKTVVAVGGQCELINTEGTRIGYKRFPLLDSEVRKIIFSHVPLQQPTLLVNKSLLPSGFVWYDENYSSAEELELIFKLFRYGKVVNLNDVVLKYRMHSHNTSLVNPKKTFYLTLKTRLIAILKYGYVPSLKGILTTIAETLFILVAPTALIYPVYSYVRGMNKVSIGSVKIKRNANFIFRRAYNLAES